MRQLRRRAHPRPASPALFVSTAGTRLLHSNIGLTFTRLAGQAGLTRRSASCRPRVHDLRHSFAVATVLGWYRDGADVAAMMPRLSTYLGHTDPQHTFWYLSAAPELMALAGQRLEAHLAGAVMTALAPTLQAFFTDRLARQRQASGHTIAAYRDALKLLLVFAAEQTGKPPSRLDIADLDAPLIGAFLNQLETGRGNSARTRNARLAAIHSLFRYAALRHPEARRGHRPGPGHPAQALRQGPDHLPHRRGDHRAAGRPRPGHLDRAARPRPADAGLPDRAARHRAHQPDHRRRAPGHRRARQLPRERAKTADHPAHRRHRRRSCAGWLAERGGLPADPLFITRRGTPLSRDALERRIARYTATAARTCPALLEKKVSPHVLRHSAAMRLLNAGVDTTVIALWMGHENVATTQVYIHADLALKERAIARTAPQDTPPGRYHPPDAVLAFLDGL